jgi:hypothetical protein
VNFFPESQFMGGSGSGDEPVGQLVIQRVYAFENSVSRERAVFKKIISYAQVEISTFATVPNAQSYCFVTSGNQMAKTQRLPNALGRFL